MICRPRLGLLRARGIVFATALFAASGFALVDLAACGSDGSRGSDDATGDGGDVVRTAVIGPGGGELLSSDGVLAIGVPPGALAGDTTLSVTTSTPNGDMLHAYELAPAGTTFAVPITLRANADPGGFDVASAALARRTADGFEALDRLEVDFANRTIAGTTTHFSSYGPVRVRVISDVVCDSACPAGYYRMWQRPAPRCAGGVETHCVIVHEHLYDYYACVACTPGYRSLASRPSISCLDGDLQHTCVRAPSEAGDDAGAADADVDASDASDASDGGDGAATCPYAGQWSGSYSGKGNGTWKVTVSPSCDVIGDHTGTADLGSSGGPEPISGGIDGRIELDGGFYLKTAVGGSTCPWEGAATSPSTANGTYSCFGGMFDGTWIGARTGP